MNKSIGIWRSWALVAGMMIGSGIFTLPSVLAPYGSYSFLGWIITGFGAMCLALSYSYLSRRRPGLGGPYAYVYEAFGRYSAAFTAWAYWISLWSASAAIAMSFAGYFELLVPWLATHQLFSSLSNNIVLPIIVVALFAFINLRGTKEAGTVQLLTTILKIIPLVLIGLAGIFYGEVRDIPASKPTDETFIQMIAGICLLITWSFIGVESATLPTEDTVEPEKTIPRASILGTLTALLVYMIAMLGVMSVVPVEQLLISTSPFADAAQQLFGNIGSIVVALGAVFAIGGALNVCILVSGTIMLAGAKDKLFPTFFAKTTLQGTPQRALVLSCLLTVALIYFNTSKALLSAFEYFLIISTFSVLLVYLGSALASLRLQWKDQQRGIKINWLTVIISLLATLFSLLALVGAWVVY
jgi:basic amino acid/polyamine antiporter, APA family